MSGEIGYGTLLKCGADSAAVSATITLGGIKNIKPPGFTRATVDMTHNASPSGFKEFIGGLAETTDMSGELIWDPVSFAATQTEMMQTRLEKSGRLFEISWPQFTPVPTCTFIGILTEFDQDAPTEDGMMATFTIKPKTIPVWVNA